MSTNPTSQCRGFIRSHLVRYALLLAGGLIAAATPAFAQSFNNLCIKEKIGGNPPCTANDVRIGTMHLIAGPSSCDPTDPTPFAVTLEATIESGPDRYDIGLWLNTEGGSALSDPSGANCYRNYLHPVGSSTVCQQQGGPYWSGEPLGGDNCGDVYAENTNPCGNAVTAPCTGSGGGTCLFTTFQFTTQVTCSDSDADNIVDAGTCTSWDNNVVGMCTNELDTDPGTGSKCSCGRVDIVGLSIPTTTTTTSSTSTSTSSSTTTSTTTSSTSTTTSTTTSSTSTTTSTTTSSTSTTTSTTTSSTSTSTSTTTTTTTSTTTTTIPGDHFQCYELKPKTFPSRTVTAQDRFGTQTLTLRYPHRLCAPADKNGEGVIDEVQHLVGYVPLNTPFTKQTGLSIANQLGTIKVDLTRRDLLMVPTAKSLTVAPPLLQPPTIDHFTCYRTKRSRGSAKFVKTTVTVADQFESISLTLQKPYRLCVPANKNGEDPTAPSHPGLLLCYRSKASAAFGTLTAHINNQFGPDDVTLIHRRELCVPSVQPPPSSPSGAFFD